MKHTSYQIIKSTKSIEGELVSSEIHCLCSSIAKCVDELFRLEECKWLGYPSGKRTLGHRVLFVDVPEGKIEYSIKAVERIVKRPAQRYFVMPKNGKITELIVCKTYEEALREKKMAELRSGEIWRISK